MKVTFGLSLGRILVIVLCLIALSIGLEPFLGSIWKAYQSAVGFYFALEFLRMLNEQS